MNNFEIILEEWKRFEFPNIIDRYISPKPSNQITAIVGPRRVGKTYLMLSIAKKLLDSNSRDNIIYVNFDDARLRKADFEDFLSALYKVFNPNPPIYLFLDEIQYTPNWDSWLRTLHNQFKYYLFIAGSSSKLLSKEVSTHLRGRYISYLLLPFSFREFLKIRNIKLDKVMLYEDIGRLYRLLDEYVMFGGFPEAILESSKMGKRKFLKTIYETIFYKDIIERFKIKNYDVARDILDYLMVNYSNKITINSLYNFFKSIGKNVSKKTIWRYIYYFQDAFAVFILEPYYPSLKKRLLLPRKIYSVDTGLSQVLDIKPSIGRLMENIVFLELMRRRELELYEIYYLYDKNYEVDFIIKSGNIVKELIQVSYDISDPETRKRELKGLVKSADKFGCKNLIIITWDSEEIIKYSGKEIKVVPILRWLLK